MFVSELNLRFNFLAKFTTINCSFFFLLQILATDNGKVKRNSTTRVAIRVSQVPETSLHSPVFKNPDHSVQLMESDHVGYLVTLAQAFDVDGDTLWYNITGNLTR